MTEIGKLRFSVVRPTVQARFRVARGGMGFVGSTLPTELPASTFCWRLSVLPPKALLACPGLDQRPIDGKVLVRQQVAPARQRDDFMEDSSAMSPSSKRSRFFENTVGAHTGSSILNPTNHRNSRL